MMHQRYTGKANLLENITETYKDDMCISMRPFSLNIRQKNLTTHSMHIFKSILCVAGLLVVVANAAPAFDFGADVIEGVNDDVQREWPLPCF